MSIERDEKLYARLADVDIGIKTDGKYQNVIFVQTFHTCTPVVVMKSSFQVDRSRTRAASVLRKPNEFVYERWRHT